MNYRVQIPKDEIKHLSQKNIKNVNVLENTVIFDTDKKSKELLIKDIDNLIFHNYRKKKIIKYVKKYFISIIAIILMFLLLVNQSHSIKSVEFIDKNTYNEELLKDIEQFYKKIGPFKYLSAPIITINKYLKQKYYYYEWISVSKKGAILKIDIKEQDQNSFLNEESTILGDIVATKDAIIKKYYVKKGIVLVKEGVSILQGEILISGNLKCLINEEQLIHPVGYVIGEVVDYENITVPKYSVSSVKSGKIETKDVYSLFGKSPTITSRFTNYELKIQEKFNWKIVRKYKVTIYEVIEVINYYKFDEATDYASSIIIKNFNEKKIDDNEKIIFMKLIEIYEDEDNYYFKYVVKKHENIAIFKELKPEIT